MLVLTRKVGEEIFIGEAIRVKVVAIDLHRVRLGIVAPANVAVDRQEVFHSKKKGAYLDVSVPGSSLAPDS